MIGSSVKMSAALVCLMAFLAAGVLFATPSIGDDQTAAAQRSLARTREISEPEPGEKGQPPRACIILWMSGGPSQIDTFDPKDGAVSLFPALDTNVKGLRFTKNLPLLAKHANHLAVIRSMKTRDADHNRAAYLMQTGFSIDDGMDHPVLGSVLAKELRAGPNLPRYVRVGHDYRKEKAVGFLEPQYGPVQVRGNVGFGQKQGTSTLPDLKEFEAVSKDNAEAMRKAIAKAFDLGEEIKATHDAYGSSPFGQGCLLARRLVDAGVPVVEVTMGGWDVHAGADAALPKLCAHLDAGFANLLKDLDQRKRLDSTLIVWMGEFGRTPRINANTGRDHWSAGFSVVLAGRGIKGGQAIGKTSADGFQVEERPVSAAELHATIYQALGINPAKEHRVTDRKSTRLNSSHIQKSRMPSSA